MQTRLPQITLQRDEISAAFYDATARGELMIQRCDACATDRAAEAQVCMGCGATESKTVAASGRATLVSWTEVERAPHPAFADVVPYLVGIVELAEGPWMPGRLIVDAGRVQAGMALRAEFHRSPDGEAYPVFTHAE